MKAKDQTKLPRVSRANTELPHIDTLLNLLEPDERLIAMVAEHLQALGRRGEASTTRPGVEDDRNNFGCSDAT